MKKHVTFLLLLFALSLCLPALAEPRYPARTGIVTDAASVLSATTVEELRILDDRLDDADALRLYVVTVDFLDGADVEDYATALFDRWRLDDDELLLLMAVGEDQYALKAGKDANRMLPPSSRSRLLTAAFEAPFLNQQYDAAIAAYVPALVREISNACDASVRTDDLFGQSSASLFDNWTSALRQTTSAASSFHFTPNVGNPDFSVLKVVAAVVVLLLVFGKCRSKKHGNQHARAGRRRHPYA